MTTRVLSQIYRGAVREVSLKLWLVKTIGVGAFVILTSLGAFVRVQLPFTPVPITLQVFFVLLSGAILGPRLGGLSQGLYLLIGVVGLPIFAGASGGLAYLFGPTGGYLVGFCVASLVVGRLMWLIKRRPTFITCWAIMIVGVAVIYVFGCSWLAFITKLGIAKAFGLGVLPFIPIDLIKVLAAAWFYSLISHRARQLFS